MPPLAPIRGPGTLRRSSAALLVLLMGTTCLVLPFCSSWVPIVFLWAPSSSRPLVQAQRGVPAVTNQQLSAAADPLPQFPPGAGYQRPTTGTDLPHLFAALARWPLCAAAALAAAGLCGLRVAAGRLGGPAAGPMAMAAVMPARSYRDRDPKYDPELDVDSPAFRIEKWITDLYPERPRDSPAKESIHPSEVLEPDYFFEEEGMSRKDALLLNLVDQPGYFVEIDPSLLEEGYTHFEFLVDVFPRRFRYFVWTCLKHPPLFRAAVAKADSDLILGVVPTTRQHRKEVQKRVAEQLVRYIVDYKERLTYCEGTCIRWWAQLANESMPQWETGQFKEEFTIPQFLRPDIARELAKAEAAAAAARARTEAETTAKEEQEEEDLEKAHEEVDVDQPMSRSQDLDLDL